MLKNVLFCALTVWVCTVVPSAYAEEVEVTTYYPSPEGEYKNLKTTEDASFATSSGNVGIGTSTPQGKLDVKDGFIWGQLQCRTVTVRGSVAPAYVSVASCDDDEWVVSGGGRCRDEDGTGNGGYLHDNYPQGNGWLVDCYKANWSGDAKSEAYAICCKKG